ncbi:MAG: DUF4260 domain-containing protein [Actinobacteria bacterium]|nr:DUF4260 domain-containing protein [Actinomycetota bacterium]
MPALAGLPRLLLRLEGAAVLAGSLVLYFDQDFGWLLLVLLALAPDLAMVGYAAGERVGAAAYDLVHTEALPVALGLVGVLADRELAVQLALIWLAHIGADRLLGYGLKYPTAFRDTHLQRV